MSKFKIFKVAYSVFALYIVLSGNSEPNFLGFAGVEQIGLLAFCIYLETQYFSIFNSSCLRLELKLNKRVVS